MHGRTRKFLRELPKVGTLLVLGALVLFPMYMMFAISVMTPAQLERFPWFPVPMDVPDKINAQREGTVSIEPAALELMRQGRPTERVIIPADDRFQLYPVGAGASDMAWTVTPDAGSQAVVAELRAAGVLDVVQAEDGTFTVGDKPFEVPAGFTSALPGLQLKAMAKHELRLVDAAFRRSEKALKAAERVSRATDESQRRRFELDAVTGLLETGDCGYLGDKSIERAHELARQAARWHISLEDDLAAAAVKMNRVWINYNRAQGRMADYLADHQQAAREQAQKLAHQPVEKLARFKADSAEAVALMLTDTRTDVRKVFGRFSIRTDWHYDLNRRRPLAIRLRPGVEKTGPQGRPTVPGRPLADLVADRDLELIWNDNEWQLDQMAFARLVPPGFEVTLADGQAGGQTQTVPKGTVLATLTEPRVQAVVSGESLIVGLALEQPDGRFRIPLGPGRWIYRLRVDRSMPFAIQATVPAEARVLLDAAADEQLSVYELRRATGDRLAELFVNRQRTVIGSRDVGWLARRDEVFMRLPPGFSERFAQPTSDVEEKKTLPHGTLLAELVMPSARITVGDEFLIVGMTGSTWGSGQWEYPLDDRRALQVFKADVPAMAGDGPWTLTSRSNEEQKRLDAALADARSAVETARQRALAEAAQGPIRRKQAELILRAAEQRLATAIQANDPQDTIAELRATRKVMLEFVDNCWTIEGRPVDWPPGFVSLSQEGGVLSGNVREVIVEPGTVLARLYAETPHPLALQDDPGLVLKTTVTATPDALAVGFTHELAYPVRANVIVADGQTIEADDRLCAFFKPQWLDLANYSEAWEYVRPFLKNTIFVAVITMIFSLLFASLSAFVFSRFDFPGKAVFYSMIIVLLMIPGVLNLVPLFVVVKNLHLLNSLWAIILPAIAGGQVMNVYIMRNNLETLAKDLFDAARIDGASNLQTYWHIAIPLSRPIMGTLAIFVLHAQWNNFIWPWIVLKDMDKMTITAGLAKLEGQHLSDFGLQMAGAVLASIPLIILFCFMMNLFIRGIQSGAIKA